MIPSRRNNRRRPAAKCDGPRALFLAAALLWGLCAGSGSPPHASAAPDRGESPRDRREVAHGDTSGEPGLLLAESPAARFKTLLANRRLEIVPDRSDAASWRLRLRFARGATDPTDGADETLELRPDGAGTRWLGRMGGRAIRLEGDDGGLTLGFTLEAPLPGAARGFPRAPQAHALAFSHGGTLLLETLAEGGEVVFRTPDGERVLRLSVSLAIAAGGKMLAARLAVETAEEGNGARVRIDLDAPGPEYFPVRIELRLGSPKGAGPLEAAQRAAVRTAARGPGSPGPLDESAFVPIAEPAADPIAEPASVPIAKPAAVPIAAPPVAPLAPPPNDQCEGAEVIPPAGPFPHLTSVIADVTEATSAGDPPLPRCQPNVSRSVWYTFTPAASGSYRISTCASAPTSTTVPDTVLSVYTSTTSACGGTMLQITGGCDDDGCVDWPLQAVLEDVALDAGTTYFIVAWQFGPSAPPAGSTALQLRIGRILPPANDTCSGASSLALDRPAEGTNAGAMNDYQLSGAACFAGTGQLPTSATGRDTVWSFAPPSAGGYAFRVQQAVSGGNPVLYISGDCPQAPPTQTVAGCLAAANRNTNTAGLSTSEEVTCHPLAEGETVFVFVDEVVGTVSGGAYTLEVNRCVSEAEPNDTPPQASPLACGVQGAVAPGADRDLFALGSPPAGSRVFALADGVSANSTDFDMRITTAADTLEYDDDNNDTPFGVSSPNCAGTPLPGGEAFVRLSHFSETAAAEPYRLYAVVQPPLSTATPETEPNDTLAGANNSPLNYFRGLIGGGPDADHFRFDAAEGDLVLVSLDADPLRDRTPFNATLALLDESGSVLAFVNDGDVASSTEPGTGSLASMVPYSPGEALVWRARRTGAHYARVRSTGGSGDYLLSISLNCQGAGGGSADVSLVKSGMPATVLAGSELTYTMSVGNAGPEPALGVTVTDLLPASTTFVSATAPAGWTCGRQGSLVTCYAPIVAAGALHGITLVVRVRPCAGDGIVISNTASLTAAGPDPDGSNNSSTATNTVSDPRTCDDGSLCTIDDACSGTVCVGSPIDCSDGNACTIDFCEPAVGCRHNPATCSDGNVCTDDTCDPVLGCRFAPNTAPCDDGNSCTFDDVCGGGSCSGTPVQSPGEVTGARFTNPATFEWDSAGSAGPGTVHDVVRGAVAELPVGAGASELCLATGIAAASATDATAPQPGGALWYLVRARNCAGTGTYGFRTVDGIPVAERVTPACP